MAELTAELWILVESLKFRKKKRATREFESENNLPHKILIHPTVLILLLALIAILVVVALADIL